MITFKVKNEPDQNWNKRLLTSSSGTIYHTVEYSKILKEVLKREPYFLTFYSPDGEIIAQLLGSKHSSKNKVKSFLRRISHKKKDVFSWTFGPVIFDPSYNNQICEKLSDFLISNNFLVRGSEHPLTNKPLTNIKKPLVSKNWSTYLIDLSLNEKDLWEKMDKHSARKNIQRSLKKGVEVREITRSEITFYQKIREETHNPVSLKVLEKRWDLLHKVGWTIFTAFSNDIPIGGIQASSFNGYVNEWGVARTAIDTNEKFYAQDLLKWSIIKWGIENKFRFYDLSGVNPNPTNSKEEGILRYKKKWGGKHIFYNQIVL